MWYNSVTQTVPDGLDRRTVGGNRTTVFENAESEVEQEQTDKRRAVHSGCAN